MKNENKYSPCTNLFMALCDASFKDHGAILKIVLDGNNTLSKHSAHSSHSSSGSSRPYRNHFEIEMKCDMQSDMTHGKTIKQTDKQEN